MIQKINGLFNKSHIPKVVDKELLQTKNAILKIPNCSAVNGALPYMAREYISKANQAKKKTNFIA